MLYSFFITPSNHSTPLQVTYGWCRSAHQHLPLSVSLTRPLLLSLPHRLVSVLFCHSHISPFCVSSIDQFQTVLLSASYAVLTYHTSAALD